MPTTVLAFALIAAGIATIVVGAFHARASWPLTLKTWTTWAVMVTIAAGLSLIGLGQALRLLLVIIQE